MTNKTKHILILEDTPARIEWLKEILEINNINAIVRSYDIVQDFIDAYQTNTNMWDLLIFDHDLTPSSNLSLMTFDDDKGIYVWDDQAIKKDQLQFDRDPQGKNGADAAASISNLKHIDNTVPILIWSANLSGAKDIEIVLKNNGGFTNVHRKAFDLFNFKALEKIIVALLQ